MSYHTPVLLHKTVEGLNIKPDGIYIDGTFGGGGHSKQILKKLGRKGKIIALDIDEDARSNVPNDKRVFFILGNFRFLQNYLKYLKIDKVDGIVADLGVSSHQFDLAERGFSFRFDSELDMRMNKNSSKTAAMFLNKYSEEDMLNVFRVYGELNNAKKLVKNIIAYREQKVINDVNHLIEAIKTCITPKKENKYLAKVFQAIRIEINGEIKNLKSLLLQSVNLLRKNGRIAIICYHSLEDKLVKNFYRWGSFDDLPQKDIYGNYSVPFQVINKKVIVPTPEEIEINNRARSAKLRIAERI